MNNFYYGVDRTPHLSHHGIKGQRWGVKNGPPYPLSDSHHRQVVAKSKTDTGSSYNKKELTNINIKTRNNVNLTMGERPSPKFTQFLSRYFPSIKDNIMRDKQFNIYAGDKKVGDAEIYKEAEDSLNIVWVGIDEDERGRGYASAVMSGIIQYAKNHSYKQVTLEVPGNSPDARHIYEKLGFKATKILSDPDKDAVWGGLTAMKLVL